MFKLPSAAYFHKEYPLVSVFRAIEANKDLKDRSKNIKYLYVDYVLNTKTTNLHADSVKEIYFYRIELANFEIPWDFLLALDKKTKFQVIYVLTCQDMEFNTTSPKIKDISNVGKTKYVSSEWRKASDDIELPNVNSLDELYCFIFGSFNKYKPFKNENIEEYIQRNNQLRKLDYQISQTEKAIQYEVQSKKRLEYNHRVNEYKKMRSELLDERRIENGKLEKTITQYGNED